jgi:hypothetical protein
MTWRGSRTNTTLKSGASGKRGLFVSLPYGGSRVARERSHTPTPPGSSTGRPFLRSLNVRVVNSTSRSPRQGRHCFCERSTMSHTQKLRVVESPGV